MTETAAICFFLLAREGGRPARWGMDSGRVRARTKPSRTAGGLGCGSPVASQAVYLIPSGIPHSVYVPTNSKRYKYTYTSYLRYPVLVNYATAASSAFRVPWINGGIPSRVNFCFLLPYLSNLLPSSVRGELPSYDKKG